MNPESQKHIRVAETEEITLDTILRRLNISLAKVEVDAAAIPRAREIANTAGKMIKGIGERSQAYRQGHIIPTHENLPFLIPANAKATPPKAKK